jgi:aldose 1-epimerase
LVNITNHTYFNLDADKKSITSHCLKMSADRVYPVDEFGCTFNQPFDVLNTPFDFTVSKPIFECLDSNHPQILTAKGLDHHFEVSGEELRQAACLSVEDCTLGVYTDKPGVHVYTGNYLNGDFDTTIAPIVKAGKIQEHLTVFEFQQMSKR